MALAQTHILLFGILLASVFNLLFIGWHLKSSFASKEKSYSWIGDDYPEMMPLPMGDLSQVSLVVEESVHYPITGLPSDDYWFGLTSANFGYARLGPNDRQFVVTMYHELHCVRLLNRAFSKEPIATIAHIKHCLAYIKQGALCAADLTLEPGDFEQRDFGRQRTGGTHKCWDFEALYPVMDKNFREWEDRAGYNQSLLPPGYDVNIL